MAANDILCVGCAQYYICETVVNKHASTHACRWDLHLCNVVTRQGFQLRLTILGINSVNAHIKREALSCSSPQRNDPDSGSY